MTQMTMDELVIDLKNQIIKQLNLEDTRPEDIDPSQPLFGDGLGLDSIDALELIVLMEKQYGVKIENPNAGKTVLSSISSMADYIMEHKKS
jgi:acyl carrier protein